MVDKHLTGKQRGAFDNYLVYNQNLRQLTIKRLSEDSLETYTTPAEPQMLLGSHELFFWS